MMHHQTAHSQHARGRPLELTRRSCTATGCRTAPPSFDPKMWPVAIIVRRRELCHLYAPKLYHSIRPASCFTVHAQLHTVTVTVTVFQCYSVTRVTALQCYTCYYLFSRASIHLETCRSGRGSGTMREGLHARMTGCIYMYVYICTL